MSKWRGKQVNELFTKNTGCYLQVTRTEQYRNIISVSSSGIDNNPSYNSHK